MMADNYQSCQSPVIDGNCGLAYPLVLSIVGPTLLYQRVGLFMGPYPGAHQHAQVE